MIATVESTQAQLPEISHQPPLPPSPRDLELYESVAVRSKTTREAAEAFGISQTRVRQVLTRVVEFLTQAVPGDDDEQTKEQKLAAAEGLAGMRLEFLYGQAMSMWRKSQTPTVQSPVPLGKVCYLNQAMRIALAAAKVPMRTLPLVEMPVESTAAPPATAPPATAPSKQTTPPAANPPVRACSENAMSSGERKPEVAPTQVTNSPAPPTYRSLDEIKAAARREFLRPAQTETAPAIGLSDRGVALAANEQPMNRRERRALRRRRLQIAK
jgi:hypothetical protein